MAKKAELLVGLDIGTSRVAAVVAELAPGGSLSVIGCGTAACEGLRRGVVVNMEATVQAIASAVKEAELRAGCEIHSVFATVGGSHIKGFNSHGVVAIKSGEVATGDVERVLDAARAVALPTDQDILHVLPQEFVVDGQDGIKEPVGMSGIRLEARVHIISTPIASAQNVIKCCQRAGLHVVDLVFAPLAAAEAVLSPEEKELGVAVVEIGAGTTGLLAFAGGAVKHTAVLAVGGNHVSSDIAAGLRTPFRDAELLKRRFGAALSSAVPAEDMVEVPTVGGRAPRELSRRILAEIVEPRLDEIFALVQRQLIRCGLDTALASGIVLTGGSVMMDGVVGLAERVFNLPVRVGAPYVAEGIDDTLTSADYAAAVGLTRYGAQPRSHLAGLVDDGHLFNRVRRRMVEWLRELM
ncbi:MAG TPA: cell division protein FtsA [Candidatus Dormibacteraeota bacterium]|nr:cell division protein FtsA [Candidatus Dormibacteraeota bacterium]